MTIYHYPALSDFDLGVIRTPGPGLGNLLFPIARALIGQSRLGGKFVFPTMRQAKIGTFLRGERDKRLYWHVLRSRTQAEWATWLHAIRCPAAPEAGPYAEHANLRINYRGLGRYFNDLVGYRDLVSGWLTANSLQADGRVAPSYDIAIHVRLSDFSPEDVERPRCGVRQSMNWYRCALDRAREILGCPKPSIVLFTDGDARVVRADLAHDGMTVDESANPLLALLRIAKARILVTSRSTFSMWGAYLGDVPAIWDARAEDIPKQFPMRSELDYTL